MSFLRSPYIKFTAIDTNGLPLTGGKVYTYIAGTNTPTNTWSDFGITLNSNPIILNSMGQANIFLIENLAYKFVIKDSLDNLVDTQDNIIAMMSTGGGGTATTLQNIGTGEGVWAQTIGSTAQLKSLKAGANIALTGSADEILFDADLSGYIAKDGTTTTTAVIPFDQGLSSALGMSITTAFGDGSAIKIPDGSWICPQTEQGGMYLTNGSNPSALNSVLHLTTSGSLFSCGDGVDQFGQISIDSGSVSLYHNEDGSSNSSVSLYNNYVTLYSGANSNVVLSSNSATMYGGDSNLTLNDTYASLYQAGSGFYIDSTGIKPQGIGAGTVSTNGFVGLNSAGYLVKTPALSTTTAGVLTRIYLNPLDVVVNGTTYNTLTSDGAGITNETQSVSSNNTLETFATSFISDGYLTDGIIRAGGYTANIWVNTNNCNHEVDYYIEEYLTDSLGVNVSLLGILASGGLVLSDNNDHIIQLTTSIPADVPYVTGQRIKFVVKAIKNTTTGGAHTLSIKYGLTHQSYIDIPVAITTDMVTDTRNGDILTASLNALQPLDSDLTAIAALSVDGLLRKASGVWGMDTNVYALASSLGSYLPLSGGTLSGALSGTNVILSGTIGVASDATLGGSFLLNNSSFAVIHFRDSTNTISYDVANSALNTYIGSAIRTSLTATSFASNVAITGTSASFSGQVSASGYKVGAGTNANFVLDGGGVSDVNLYPTLAGINTFSDIIKAGKGGESLQLLPSTVDHCYLAFYARTANPTTRSGVIGYGGAGLTTMLFSNSLGAFSFDNTVNFRVGTALIAPLNIGAFGVSKTTPIDGDIWKSAADTLVIRMSTNTRTIPFAEKNNTFGGTQTFSVISSTSTITARQWAQTRQTSATSTGSIAWALGSGGTMDLTTALTGAITMTITAPTAGGQSNLYLTQGATVQSVILSLTGVTWIVTGANGLTGTNTVTLPSASFAVNKTYCMCIFWSTATRAYVTIT